ncbi:MAG: HD domain-containing protein [Candidatus Heimdallarchaeota archaeon]|nr:HD domain-containing protein [Candidatus Heimdallarchaeota archaeon]
MTEKVSKSESSIILPNLRTEKILSLVLEELESTKGIARDQPFSWSLTHAISCSQISKILAASRGLDIEIAAITGAIHDLAIIRTGKFENHGPLGAPMVIEFLHGYNSNFGKEFGIVSQEEVDVIAQATQNHTYKTDFTDNEFDELIKDADSLDRFLHGKKTFDFYFTRSEKALKDIGLKIKDIL